MKPAPDAIRLTPQGRAPEFTALFVTHTSVSLTPLLTEPRADRHAVPA